MKENTFVKAVLQPDGTYKAKKFKVSMHLQVRKCQDTHGEVSGFETIAIYNNDEDAHKHRNTLQQKESTSRIIAHYEEIGDA